MKLTIYIGLPILVLMNSTCHARSLPTGEDHSTSSTENTEAPASALGGLKNPPMVSRGVLLEQIEKFESGNSEKRHDQDYFKERNPRICNGFDRYGWTVSVKFESEEYEFHEEPLKLTAVMYSNRKPRYGGGVTTAQGDRPGRGRIGPKVTATAASVTAREFVKDHWSKAVLDGLYGCRPELAFGEKVYSVDWNMRKTKDSILLGIKSISIYVNAETGDVFYARIIDIKPPESTEIGPDRFLEIIKGEFEALQGLNVESMRLYTEYTKEMKRRSIWAADITFSCPVDKTGANLLSCNGLGTIMIDADTGEILEKSTL